MRLISVRINNFRCYQNEVVVQIDDLTTFIGRNDIGKSSVLEALEIFFNNDTVKIESDDANIISGRRGDHNVSITCEFTELPLSLTLDAGAETTLADEYLLTEAGTLKIQKVYDCSGAKPSTEVFIIAQHPTAAGVSGLLELKERELQALVRAKGLAVPLRGNPGMRRAVWEAEADLALAEVKLTVNKSKEDSKRIWEQLDNYLPMFALFQSDRSSRDSDGEVQTPMKAAVAAAIAEMQGEIDLIQRKVMEKAEAIAVSTLKVLQSIDANLARELNPQFTAPTTSKWVNLFAINMDTDDGIPLNKRGSGVRRLVLVSFFKAEAERRMATGGMKRSIIYAVEEPETAQHPNNQKILIESFKALAGEPGYQVLLTTHSPGFAAELPTDSIRFVTRDAAGKPRIDAGVDVFDQVAQALGVVADSKIKVLLCVEGPTDVTAFKCLSRALHLSDPTIPDLVNEGRVAFIVLGGSTLQHWVSEHYLRALGRPEVHIYDSDVAAYGASVAEVNQREDRSWAVQTLKYEVENYLHADAIHEAFGITVAVPDQRDANGRAVPAILSAALFATNPERNPISDRTAKKRLASDAFPRMTAARLQQRDPEGEVEGWFRRIGAML